MVLSIMPTAESIRPLGPNGNPCAATAFPDQGGEGAGFQPRKGLNSLF
jgi:hypothetical protein